MFDASMMEHGENVKVTAEVVAWCHARGVAVEAELGEVGGRTACTPLASALTPRRPPPMSRTRGSTPSPSLSAPPTQCSVATRSSTRL